MVVTFVILLPIDIANGGTQTGVDRLTFGNVVEKQRYVAHLITVWFLTCEYRETMGSH